MVVVLGLLVLLGRLPIVGGWFRALAERLIARAMPSDR